MKSKAAVLVETGKPLEIWELEIPPLLPGQVLVKMAFSGVCHTQILEARGYKGVDPYVPHCMGHEGTGTVVEIGSGVKKVRVGEKVLLSWIKGSGADVPGTKYRGPGNVEVNAGGVTTFCSLSVVSENRVTPLPAALSLAEGPMVGCAIATGMGAVFNTGGIKPGAHVVVFGCGGIGLFAIAAARIGGAEAIVAIDPLPRKRSVAHAMGATHTLDGSGDIVVELKKLIPSGIDVAIEATGKTDVMEKSLEIVRNQGGIAVVIGNAHHGERISLDPKLLNMGKQLRGTWGGDSFPDRDFPRYCEYLISGELSVAPLSSSLYQLERINEALKDLENGIVVRPMIATT